MNTDFKKVIYVAGLLHFLLIIYFALFIGVCFPHGDDVAGYNLTDRFLETIVKFAGTVIVLALPALYFFKKRISRVASGFAALFVVTNLVFLYGIATQLYVCSSL